MKVVSSTPARLELAYHHLFSTSVLVLVAVASLAGVFPLFWDETVFILIGIGILVAGAAIAGLLARFMVLRESWVFDAAAGQAHHVWQSHLSRTETVIELSRISGTAVIRWARNAHTREPLHMPVLVLKDGTTHKLLSHSHIGSMPHDIAKTVDAWLKAREPGTGRG